MKVRLRILALHGKASNGKVTKLQLTHLGITDDKFDIVYLDGPIVEEQGGPEVTQLVNGPFHSWFYSNYSDARYKQSFLRAVSNVILFTKKMGPFDAIYGFSQGATVAAFAALSFTDIELGKSIIDFNNSPESRVPESNSISIKRSSGSTNLHFEQVGGASNRDGLSRHMFTKSLTIAGTALHQSYFNREEFSDYIVLACPVDDPTAIRNALGLVSSSQAKISIPSMHLIGVDDPRKTYSEMMQALFSDAQVRYMVGGHAVPRNVNSDKELMRTLQKNLLELENVNEMEPPIMKFVSDVTSMGLMSSVQVAHVELNCTRMENTLMNALSQTDRNKPLLMNARDIDGSNYTSYGDVLDFIEDGPGDLRRLNVKEGEVVAYGAPPGGGEANTMPLDSNPSVQAY